MEEEVGEWRAAESRKGWWEGARDRGEDGGRRKGGKRRGQHTRVTIHTLTVID